MQPKTGCTNGHHGKQSPVMEHCIQLQVKAWLTKIRLGHGHGPLGHWCGSSGRVETHVIQGLIHQLPRVLPCGDFFYVTKRKKTIIFLIFSIIILITITNNSTTVHDFGSSSLRTCFQAVDPLHFVSCKVRSLT